MTHPGQTSEFSIRPAGAHELPATRILLPDAFDSLVAPIVFVATVGAPAAVVGAVAMNPRQRGRIPGFSLWLRVAAPYRRRGIATALVAEAQREAQTRGVKSLQAPGPIDAASPEAAAWRALRFDRDITVNHYEADPARMSAVLTPIWDRWRTHRAGPHSDARIVGMAEVPPQNLALLHVTHLGGGYAAVMRRLRGGPPNAFDPDVSYALLKESRLVGAALGRLPEPGVGFLDAIVILPECRMSWAYPMLIANSVRRGVELGLRAIRFTAHDQHRDTRKMAARVAAKLTRTTVVPYQEIL